jgi:chromate reductase, NAD(P)H dehydrogenase (quinone)
MTNPNIAVLIGSLRRESFNPRLAAELMRLAEGKLGFSEVDIRDLPLYDQDDDDSPAPSVVRLRDEIRAVDGV